MPESKLPHHTKGNDAWVVKRHGGKPYARTIPRGTNSGGIFFSSLNFCEMGKAKKHYCINPAQRKKALAKLKVLPSHFIILWIK